jgi:hypothetical protein
MELSFVITSACTTDAQRRLWQLPQYFRLQLDLRFKSPFPLLKRAQKESRPRLPVWVTGANRF